MGHVETIVAAMAAGVGHREIQLAQTRYRLDLVRRWGIRPGASVLEIGCGQGDMTAVLADAVGTSGRVVGVDIADPSYGSPVTLGESAAFLAATELGARVDMRFGVDVLDPAVTFGDDGFDHVVLAHCAWYFAS
ncbi:MAG TPA: methyltransferase domain-containing protein, partial [Pseudonocardiaceae bacterium]|nr:methyltransferase domain-containing protein [Pseudonocardiaceae bacterium]